MRHFLILFKHELRMLLIHPSTYIAGFLFLSLMGTLYWLILQEMATRPQETLPVVEFFRYFWIPTFFVIPLLTMRSIAGERNIGTLDTLLTTPASRTAIVLSKFAGAYVFYLLLWITTLGFPLIAAKLFPSAAESGRLLEAASIIGGFSFIATSGILFVSIGIFASSISRSQLVAGMFTFTTLFVIIIGGQIIGNFTQESINLPDWMAKISDYLQIFNHLDDFARGIIDTRPFFYYASISILLLGVTKLVIEAKT